MDRITTSEVFGIKVANVSYSELSKYIKETIDHNKRRIITYVTAHSLNIIYKNCEVKEIFNKFNIIHPDGIGTFLAIRFLYGKKNIEKKITGSDFYPILIDAAIRYKWRIFFWGNEINVLERIQNQHEGLDICGYDEGYKISLSKIIQNINMSKADILIVGMGCPLQESWIIKVKDELDVKVILAVGDGIKIFANVRNRGTKLFRNIGLEWAFRLLSEPGRLWKRYIIGIPLFILRIIKLYLRRGKNA
jgi:N-acetylglucosaminyldiphosphoundecaprenol N-acetyl-beta-D-mannosaminyltransferase